VARPVVHDPTPNDLNGKGTSAVPLGLPQHPDEHRPQVLVLLGVDQELDRPGHESGGVEVPVARARSSPSGASSTTSRADRKVGEIVAMSSRRRRSASAKSTGGR
jgi:hypothetical protein